MSELGRQLKIILITNGILALIAGLALAGLFYAYPELTLRALTVFLAAYLIIDAVLTLYFGAANRLWGYMAAGLTSLVLALFLLFWPALSIVGLVWGFAAWAFILGLGRIIEAAINGVRRGGRAWAALNGALSVVLGLILLLFPAAGAMSFVFLLAVYFTLSGAGLIIYGLVLRTEDEEPQISLEEEAARPPADY